MYYIKPIFGRCCVHVSLEPIFNLGTTHGVVCFFSLMSIISSFARFVVVGVVNAIVEALLASFKRPTTLQYVGNSSNWHTHRLYMYVCWSLVLKGTKIV